MKLYQGIFSEKKSKEPVFTFSLLDENIVSARSRLRGAASLKELHLLTTKDLGEFSKTPPPLGSGEDKLMAAIFRTNQTEHGMPEDFENLQPITN